MGVVFLFTGCLRTHWSVAVGYTIIVSLVIANHVNNVIPRVTKYNLTEHYYMNPVWILLMAI